MEKSTITWQHFLKQCSSSHKSQTDTETEGPFTIDSPFVRRRSINLASRSTSEQSDGRVL